MRVVLYDLILKNDTKAYRKWNKYSLPERSNLNIACSLSSQINGLFGHIRYLRKLDE